MAKKFLVPIDLNQLELQNAALQNLATAPSNPVDGQVYFNTTTNKAMVYDGSAWVPWEANANTVTGVKGDSEGTYRTGDVNITAANVGAASSGHSHGNITNAGRLQTTDITIANGDKLVVTDSSDNSKVARASVSFDGSTTTQALTKKGTFETFNNYTHPTYTAASAAAIKVGRDSTGHVVTGDALAASDVGAAPTSHASSATTYGTGTSSNYGHVKLSDSTTSTSSTSGGTAATPKAVSDAIAAAADETDDRIAALLDTFGQAVYKDVDISISSGSTSAKLPTTAAVASYVAAELAALPADQFLDLNNTTFVLNFQWSSTLYPGSTNPNLDGKPVLVLALTDGTSDVYSFLDVEDLFNSYTGTSPISVSGQTISHANSGVSAGSKGDTSNQTPAWGGTFKALSGTVNATGHLTAFAEHTVTIPNATATTTNAGLMSSTDKIKIDEVHAIEVATGKINAGSVYASISLEIGVGINDIISVNAYLDNSTSSVAVFDPVVVDWQYRDNNNPGPAIAVSIAAAQSTDVLVKIQYRAW